MNHSDFYEKQLRSHIPKMSKATALVALTIARRIDPLQNSARISQNTIYNESFVQSKATVIRALQNLQELNVIEVALPKKGTRLASKITWTLQCPQNCHCQHETERVVA